MKNSIAYKYDSRAWYFGLYDILFFYPLRFRARGADALGDVAGKRVLEIGCGSGLNFKYLVERVGSAGAVRGIDISERMIAVAQTRCDRNLWNNAFAELADAAEYHARTQFDAVYFGLSFTVLRDPRKVLDNILEQLRPGGRLVVLETRIPEWIPGFARKWVAEYAHRTFGTSPDIEPWGIFEEYECRGVLKNIHIETVRHYSFYVLSAEKA